MKKKILSYVGAAVIASTGVAVATASPAFAAGGCSAASNPTVQVCVNHGDDGNSTRGDFYINRTPDSSVYYYRSSFIVNNAERNLGGYVRITSTGRKCCTYIGLATLPISTKTVKTRVRIYTSTKALHMTVDSPAISVRN
ncbi:hypothetical protein [Actinoplanes derwentensis]|uniref:Peptidase inhibitor family I36 n=1 Tax=Actinoplanes derwentensis TaxID=113562 RepID=A0A1H2D3Q8_9ACTN|nr:hypothetical protein [Actinoplanes derwentensis]GID88317.1 hypothetical protein Ade03nite_72410 [Actinoplanes derwentensis]SDT77189.1 hypothetical protein SAMN04489716_7859 [Actinoplanes derwentensis]